MGLIKMESSHTKAMRLAVSWTALVVLSMLCRLLCYAVCSAHWTGICCSSPPPQAHIPLAHPACGTRLCSCCFVHVNPRPNPRASHPHPCSQTATRSNISVALSQNVSGPNINVSPTIAPHISPHIVSSNAQTGEGNVTPAVGSGGDLGGSYAAAPGAGAAVQGAGLPPMMPGALPAGFLLVPNPQVG